jgi:polar amino acid transport system substrate-binding protein
MNALGPLASWQIYNVDATQFYRAILVLSLNSSAYLAEIFRAGIQSIHKGQLEAARSLGMTWPQSMAFVIIPQTVRRILPTMMSEFILLFKDTSILFAVGIFELTLQARTIQAAKFNMSPYIAAAGFYLMLTMPLGRFVANLEQRLSVAETGRGGQEARQAARTPRDSPIPEGTISTSEVGLR